jgi:hypothetical protein
MRQDLSVTTDWVEVFLELFGVRLVPPASACLLCPSCRLLVAGYAASLGVCVAVGFCVAMFRWSVSPSCGVGVPLSVRFLVGWRARP